MITRLIIDASVALKWLLDETYSEKAAQLLEQREKFQFLAPDVLVTEVVNGLFQRGKKGEMELEHAKALHTGLFVEDIISICPGLDYVARAYDLAHEIGHNAIYDCIYLSMAESLRCELLTADQAFIKRAQNSTLSAQLFFIANIH